MEMLDAAVSPFFIGVNDHFGIAASAKSMAAILEFGSQFRKIVDLPVKNDSDIARFVKDRLAAAGKIDDAQAANAKNDAGLREHVLVVRPSMGERLHHVANAPFGRRRARANYAANAAHSIFSSGPIGPRLGSSIHRRKALPFPPEVAPNSSRERLPRNPASGSRAALRRSIDGGREPTLRTRG